MEKLFKCKVKNNVGYITDVSNKKGYCTKISKYDTVMFYPNNKKPYRVALKKEEVEFI